ncbi:YggT family protein [Secundilactobacillus similis]|uniref:YggT family protein n=1 Tax=Secundilactobacillus similis TaxID=414682 RepID=UPI0034E26E2D
MLAIIVYALMSWFPGAYQTGFGRFLGRIVEPFQSWFNFAHVGMLAFNQLSPSLCLALFEVACTTLRSCCFGFLAGTRIDVGGFGRWLIPLRSIFVEKKHRLLKVPLVGFNRLVMNTDRF